MLTTASGLLFTGDNEGNLLALDSRTGKLLWNYQMGSNLHGTSPTTYMLDGRQHLLVPAGHDADRVGAARRPPRAADAMIDNVAGPAFRPGVIADPESVGLQHGCMNLATACLVIGTLMATVIAAANPEAEKYWPQWRGPHATGVSPHGDAAARVERDEEHPLEGRDPRPRLVVAGRLGRSHLPADRRFRPASPAAASAQAARRRRSRACRTASWCCAIDRADRQDRLGADRARGRRRTRPSHPDNGTWASSSAITDGEHVIASFESRGIYAYDMNGTLVWQKDLGDKKMRNEFGEGSTPALHGNTLVVVWDHFVRASRSSSRSTSGPARSSGASKRDEIDTWATPLVVEHDGRAQVIVPRHEPAAQLRPRDRRRSCGKRRARR